MKPRIVTTVLACLVAIPASLHAQSPGEDSVDVWAVVEAQWNALESRDDAWIDELLVDEFAGWGTNSPAPRNKASVRMWQRFNDRQGRLVAHELYPLSIVVRNDVAIAHYLYSSAYEDKDGDVEMATGRFTDVLVRTDGGWRFLSWHGGDD